MRRPQTPFDHIPSYGSPLRRLLSVAALALLAACGSDDSGGGTPTLSDLETGLFASSCAFSSCHGSASAGGLNLEPGNAHDQLVGVEATNAAAAGDGVVRVKAGAPDESLLIMKLEGPPSGYGDRMPQRNDPLSESQIARVRAWIEAGAPDN